ncbi:hypothetical protein TVAG_258200 [Trichomonas vaginalis G3]|uniref:Uncharacterized protein n=1 Tax=Trichomonas vaginalis (strain ATCC PRA-98 / G3) TaxID=412133 RepID=A2E924_TRIV3|nr:hypothetical protein TVAGG3_0542120 [Trichomonas vaginalis G3]EAY10818.1 hypothetical protein TVAG_258200 [Trichomonas vaginalis G3]KAI5519906.1 hypothetical protein TVAGG3_0542120 [Trichomonas vaginalis G3]|eukprot:XP_001323041.1 hypothetical protein [Trichomonas vaginalis G3]
MTDDVSVEKPLFKYIPNEIDSSGDDNSSRASSLADSQSSSDNKNTSPMQTMSTPELASEVASLQPTSNSSKAIARGQSQFLPPPPSKRPPPPIKTKERSYTLKSLPIPPPPSMKPPPPKRTIPIPNYGPDDSISNPPLSIPDPPPFTPPPPMHHSMSGLPKQLQAKARRREKTVYAPMTAPIVQDDSSTILSFLDSSSTNVKGTGMFYEPVEHVRLPPRPRSISCLQMPIDFSNPSFLQEQASVSIKEPAKRAMPTRKRIERKTGSFIGKRDKSLIDTSEEDTSNKEKRKKILQKATSVEDPTLNDENGAWRKLPETLTEDDLKSEIENLKKKIAIVSGQNKFLNTKKAEFVEELRNLRNRITEILMEDDNL